MSFRGKQTLERTLNRVSQQNECERNFIIFPYGNGIIWKQSNPCSIASIQPNNSVTIELQTDAHPFSGGKLLQSNKYIVPHSPFNSLSLNISLYNPIISFDPVTHFQIYRMIVKYKSKFQNIPEMFQNIKEMFHFSRYPLLLNDAICRKSCRPNQCNCSMQII